MGAIERFRGDDAFHTSLPHLSWQARGGRWRGFALQSAVITTRRYNDSAVQRAVYFERAVLRRNGNEAQKSTHMDGYR